MHPLHSVGTNNKAIRDAASFGYHEFILQLPNSQDRGKTNKTIHQERDMFLGLVCRRNGAAEMGLNFDVILSLHSKVTGIVVGHFPQLVFHSLHAHDTPPRPL